MTRGQRLLREWLNRSTLMQKELAARLGISDGYLSQILGGRRRSKLEILMAIERETGIPVSAWADIRVSETDQVSEAHAKTGGLQ